MKAIYKSKMLTIWAPSSRMEWYSMAMLVTAAYLVFSGRTSEAIDFFQIAVLFEILDRMPNKER